MKYKIISIRKKPWWKIWKTANWEVTVEYEFRQQLKRKTVSIYTTFPYMLEDYVKNKLETGQQWILVHHPLP